jgi:DNA repair photolyase
MSWRKNDKNSNMYPWIDFMHSHLRGQCPHECDYCYTQKMRCARFYQGPLTLKEKELKVKYGEGNTIFIEYMNDLFAEDVPGTYIDAILNHCAEYPKNNYVFQTKNPKRAWEMSEFYPILRTNLIGTTIETNRENHITEHSKAPPPYERFVYITKLHGAFQDTFITIEPVMKFDPKILGGWIVAAHPKFVNIGADSKHCKLPEPQPKDLNSLLNILKDNNVEVREKHNLGRLLDD